MMRVDLHQVFILGTDSDKSCLHTQTVTVPQSDCLRKIDQHFRTQNRFQNDTTSEAAIIVDQDAIDLFCRIPIPGLQDCFRAYQNRKYRCAIGRIVAGSQVSSTPSARTS